MGKSEMTKDFKSQIDHFKNLFARAVKLSFQLDWNDDGFSWDKAFVCSVMAKVAYLHIPKYELEASSHRFNIIPCETYRLAKATKQQRGLASFFESDSDINQFVVETVDMVAVGIQVGKVVFIAIRGTQCPKDWFVNLRCGKIPISVCHDTEYRIHKGFGRAVAESKDEVWGKLAKKFSPDLPVYVCGHSLGGAMSAIFHALHAETGGLCWRGGYETKGCYTFGMPRYGNPSVMCNLPNPYHIHNRLDIVPSVPLSIMGYDDGLHERCLLDNCSEGNHARVGGLTALKLIAGKQVIPNHDIELYIDRLRDARLNWVPGKLCSKLDRMGLGEYKEKFADHLEVFVPDGDGAVIEMFKTILRFLRRAESAEDKGRQEIDKFLRKLSRGIFDKEHDIG